MTFNISAQDLFLLLLALLPIGYFIRKGILAYINSSVNHKFEKKLEDLRAIYRRTEEDIRYLHNTVTSAINTTESISKPYQLKAIDNLWHNFIEINKYHRLALSLASINITEVKKSWNDQKIKTFVKFYTEQINMNELNAHAYKARIDRIWVTPMAWALYSAYETLINYLFSQFLILDLDEDPDRFLSTSKIIALIKEIDPNSEEKQSLPNANLPIYLDYLEQKLLVELQENINVKNKIEDNIEVAKKIIRLATEAQTEIQKETSKSPANH
ncbi:hypothetical protein [Fluoribacter dumoffii]|uniref:Uncharacterized protein n=1 Tax=Fluoribacter dumoffii TaxID=463 RepID=A0A377IU59_9GAMM|nr:hypothetical protein [Fluoribacter dumoffii]STO91736.1 Uncharacterised protein [Fluoribacter dumoffii]